MEIRTFLENIRVRTAILSFSGWPDAGKVVRNTLDEMRGALHFTPAASLDMDGFWNVQSTRPQVDIRHGQIRKMEWPSFDLSLCDHAYHGPLAIGSGPEPVCNWRSFGRHVLDLLAEWECTEVILLGCVYDHITHEETVVSSVVQDSHAYNRLKELGCNLIEYKGPGAVHSSLMETAKVLNIPCSCIWAHFPFYLRGPHEMLTANLLGILGSLLGLEFNTDHLVKRWEKRVQEIEALITQDLELQRVLDNLKKQRESEPPASPAKIVRLDEFLKKRNESQDE